MQNLKLKRIGAYLIDLFVVSMLVVLINQINFVNPNKDKYLKVYDEYTEYYESKLGNVTEETVDSIINDEYAEYMYDLQYYAIGNTLAESLVIILYFTLFPKFNNNQTIGKRLFKIKLVNKDKDKKVTSIQLLLRSIMLPIVANIIMYTAVTSLLNVGALFLFKGIKYLYVNLIITYIINFLCYADIISIFVRKDNMALHDIITGTKVVEMC